MSPESQPRDRLLFTLMFEKRGGLRSQDALFSGFLPVDPSIVVGTVASFA